MLHQVSYLHYTPSNAAFLDKFVDLKMLRCKIASSVWASPLLYVIGLSANDIQVLCGYATYGDPTNFGLPTTNLVQVEREGGKGYGEMARGLVTNY